MASPPCSLASSQELGEASIAEYQQKVRQQRWRRREEEEEEPSKEEPSAGEGPSAEPHRWRWGEDGGEEHQQLLLALL